MRRQGLNLVAAGFALTALSYGLARFAYGLLLPQIREELTLGVAAAGWIGGSAFAAYCLGILLAFAGNGRFGPRPVVLAAAVAATLGMALVSLAQAPLMLGLGIALAGLSTGLTSPPLAQAVARVFGERQRPRANATINAGTAAGIVLSGAAAGLAAGAWRELYAGFALLGAGVGLWLYFAVPAARGASLAAWTPGLLARPGVRTLCLSALLMGIASAALWTFGADLLQGEYGFPGVQIAGVWVLLGFSGLSGALTGRLTQQYGSRRVHSAALLLLALATLGLASSAYAPLGGFVAMALFGAAYIVSTGCYLIQGVALLEDRPDLGLGVPFLVLALGQAAGSPLFGALLAATGVLPALALFAAIACLAAMLRP